MNSQGTFARDTSLISDRFFGGVALSPQKWCGTPSWQASCTVPHRSPSPSSAHPHRPFAVPPPRPHLRGPAALLGVLAPAGVRQGGPVPPQWGTCQPSPLLERNDVWQGREVRPRLTEPNVPTLKTKPNPARPALDLSHPWAQTGR